MNDFRTRMLSALSVGAIVGIASQVTGFSDTGYLSSIIICTITAGFSYWFVHNWRKERGFDHSGPITNYFFVVLLSWGLFGFLLAPNRAFAPMSAAISISMLLPPFLELVREFSALMPKKADAQRIDADKQ